MPQEAIDRALQESLDPDVRAALTEAMRRARVVHEAQLPAQSDTTPAAGLAVSTRYVPVSRAGVYVPGGLVAYPSSVVMNVVPAQAAGVESITVASPPQQATTTACRTRSILAACGLLGITEVHAIGGAQALGDARLRHRRVRPGRRDHRAGQHLRGRRQAGAAGRSSASTGRTARPRSRIIADHTADPRFVAADLIGQAEHDENAGCLLITTDPALADKVDEELARQIPQTLHRERVETALRGQAGDVFADDIDAAVAISDAWAPEHLEIQAEDAAKVALKVRNAGAIFVGSYSPCRLGDYLAGSNHVLPTGGTARHTSGLSVHPYLRVVNVIECDRDSLSERRPARRRPRRGRGPGRPRGRRPHPRAEGGAARGSAARDARCPPPRRGSGDNQRAGHCPFGMT